MIGAKNQHGGTSLLLVMTILATTTAFSISSLPQFKGRKLFGGYRITPRECKPTNPPRLKSNEPAICMFNYECSRRKGEVVGVCRESFLFGACCQLPPSGTKDIDELQHPRPSVNVHEIDHVPDIPILLSPDGTPLDKPDETSSTVLARYTTPRPTQHKDSYQNAERPQLPVVDDLKLPSLLGQADDKNNLDDDSEETKFANTPLSPVLKPGQVFQISDPVDRLPSLFSQGIAQQHSALKNESRTKPQMATTVAARIPSTKKPVSTVTLKPVVTQASLITKSKDHQKLPATTPIVKGASSHRVEVSKATTPMSTLSTRDGDYEFIPVQVYHPSVGQTGNKKKENLDKQELAINHIISILNDTSDPKITTQGTSSPTTYKWVTASDGSLKPSLVKLSSNPLSVYPTTESSSEESHSPSISPSYYHYNTGSSSYGTTPTFSGSSSGRPSPGAPAPTLIVLGPLGTEYTTASNDGQSTKYGTVSKKPSSTKPTLITKKPGNVLATVTHNISTVFNSGNKQVVSVSYISSVNSKDGTTEKPGYPNKLTTGLADLDATGGITKKPTIWTTISSWTNGRPSGNIIVKPSPGSGIQWSDDNGFTILKDPSSTEITKLTTNPACDDDVVTSDELNNFPPVRHPELEATGGIFHQEKPTIVEPTDILSEDEIPTPDFVEDEELNSKVNVFVDKIVQSLQGNFQTLKDVVYNPKNITNIQGSNVITKIPTTPPPLKRPQTLKPAAKPPALKPLTSRPLKKPAPTKNPYNPVTTKISTLKPVKATPATVTKKPTTYKKPRPTQKIATTPQTPTDALDTESYLYGKPAATTPYPEITPNADFRSICGIRPLASKTGRIVGGKGATFGKWPWQVLVREATWLGLFTKNKCGGVLITDKYVITAAHCQPGFLASLVAVFGEFDISGELEQKRSVTRNVRRVIVNRGYDPGTFENDLALLELDIPITFDDHIVPICMPEQGVDYTGRMATVTGWGRLKYNGGVPSVLQEVKVPIMENSVCQEMFQTAGHSKLILESFMCAGYANGQKDSCEGDSGGPLTLQRPDGRWILVGTVSHGIKCAAPYLPGVYMRTGFFKPWLHSITGV